MINEEQQIKEEINKSRNILITTKKFFNSDNLSTALAWHLLLKKLNKNVELVIDDFETPAELKFLSNIDSVKKELNHLKKYIISLDISQTELEELSYEIVDKELQIYLSPKSGKIQTKDLSLKDENYRFDLIIVVGCQELESLGKIYDNHPDFFYKTSIINIDCQSQNDRFGQINYIDLNKTSVAEITYNLFNNFNQNLIDEKITTCLLTGLIVATNGFKSFHLTPECLITASKLITRGADKEKIVTNLYRNKSIKTLKLWGKILTRLKSEKDNRIIWSRVNTADYEGLKFQDNDFVNILNELLSTARQADILILFAEQKETTKIFLYNNNLNLNLMPLVRQFNGQGDKRLIIFNINKDIDSRLEEFLLEIKKYLSTIYQEK
jgi:nanoRNase/pAp phosphatase (c-di-AMP/oligoRNAs hydrolase)